MDDITLNENAIIAAEPEEAPATKSDDFWDDWSALGIKNDDDVSEADKSDDSKDTAKPESNESEKKDSDEEEDTPDFLDVKFNHEGRKLSKKEARTFAQMGMNYGKIKDDLDTTNAQLIQYKQYEEFLNEIKGNFSSIEDMMVDARARMMVNKEAEKGNTITLDNAKETVKQRMPKPIDKKQLSTDMAVRDFKRVYPKVKAADIPQEVWDDVKLHGSLLVAYHDYEMKSKDKEIKELKKKNEALETNTKNTNRSNGSMKSSGGTKNDSNAVLKDVFGF